MSYINYLSSIPSSDQASGLTSKKSQDLPSDASTSPGWHDHLVTLVRGQYDTRKSIDHKYFTKRLGDIFRDSDPGRSPKSQALAMIPSSYHAHDARQFDVQREKGQYVCMTADIDVGGHDFDLILKAVQDCIEDEVAVLIYSSSSAMEDDPKWRILVPLASALPNQEWIQLQEAFYDSLKNWGIDCDLALTRSAQLVYLPNVPPEKRSTSDNQPIFFKRYFRDGRGLLVTDNGIASALVQRHIKQLATSRAQSKIQQETFNKLNERKTHTSFNINSNSIIEQYNAKHDIERLMEKYGYVEGPQNTWRSPYQTSTTYGTKVFDNYWVSLSDSDARNDLGRSCSSGRFGDAFDLYRHYEFSGDLHLALQSLKTTSTPVAPTLPNPMVSTLVVQAPQKSVPDQKSETTIEEQTAASSQTKTPSLSFSKGVITHIDMAQHFALLAAGRYRWSEGMDWLVNRGSHWEEDCGLERHTLVKKIMVDATDVTIMNLGSKGARGAGSFSSSHNLEGVLALARTELGIKTPMRSWDDERMVLNTPAAAIDLCTGKPVSRDHLLFTQVTSVSPSDMPTPVWTKFIHQVFNDDLAMVEFIQRLGGYCLSGSIKEQKLFFFYGEGANGKSVLLDTIRNLLGMYSYNLPSEALMSSRNERHPTMYAALQGKRLAVSSEIESTAHWSENLIKQLTGDETLTARKMRQDFYTFAVTHKHLVAGNSRPRLKGDDYAMIRRMVLVPFTQRFEGDRRDPDLGQKLKVEYPGILQWFIEGACKWANNGLKIPAAVIQASNDYMHEQNDIALWLEDCCHVSPEQSSKAGALYASFSSWKTKQGEIAGSAKSFYQRLPGQFSKKRCNQGMIYHGVSILRHEM